MVYIIEQLYFSAPKRRSPRAVGMWSWIVLLSCWNQCRQFSTALSMLRWLNPSHIQLHPWNARSSFWPWGSMIQQLGHRRGRWADRTKERELGPWFLPPVFYWFVWLFLSASFIMSFPSVNEGLHSWFPRNIWKGSCWSLSWVLHSHGTMQGA